MAQVKFSTKNELLWVKVKLGDEVIKHGEVVSWMEIDGMVTFFDSKAEPVVSVKATKSLLKKLNS